MTQKLLFLLFCLSGTLLFSEEKLYFLHIPKTGGVSVTTLLLDHYTAEQTMGSGSLIASTHDFYYRTKESFKGYKLITFLRHPVSRVLSEHRYLSTATPQDYLNHFLPPNKDPIDTISNQICKILSGLNPQDPSILIEQHLEKAKKTLAQHVFFVGITEKMNESIEMLFEQLGWQLPEEIPIYNSTDKSKEFYPQEVFDDIARRNWADIELYEYALVLFDEQKKQMSYKRIPVEKQTFVNGYHYSFDQKLDGFGWCMRDPEQKYSRWIAPKNKAGINFYLNTDHSYSLKCGFLIQPIFLDLLRISINGVPVPFENVISKNKNKSTFFTKVCCIAVIPQELLKEGKKTTITFEMIPPEDPQAREYYETTRDRSIPHYSLKGRLACRGIMLEPL